MLTTLLRDASYDAEQGFVVLFAVALLVVAALQFAAQRRHMAALALGTCARTPPSRPRHIAPRARAPARGPATSPRAPSRPPPPAPPAESLSSSTTRRRQRTISPVYRLFAHTSLFVAVLQCGRAVDPFSVRGIYSDFVVNIFSYNVTCALLGSLGGLIYFTASAGYELARLRRPPWMGPVVATLGLATFLVANLLNGLRFWRDDRFVVYGLFLFFLCPVELIYFGIFCQGTWRIRAQIIQHHRRLEMQSANSLTAGVKDDELAPESDVAPRLNTVLAKQYRILGFAFVFVVLALIAQVGLGIDSYRDRVLTVRDPNNYSFAEGVFVWVQFGFQALKLYYAWLPLRLLCSPLAAGGGGGGGGGASGGGGGGGGDGSLSDDERRGPSSGARARRELSGIVSRGEDGSLSGFAEERSSVPSR
jgi:hypothetical protein